MEEDIGEHGHWTRLASKVLRADIPLAARPAVACGPVHSLALGLVGRAPHLAVREAGESMHEMVRMVAESLRRDHPGAHFTTLQVNRGFAAVPHVDVMNVGMSYSCALGDFEGGALWVEDKLGATKMRMPDMQGALMHLSGTWVRGRNYDSRYRWVQVAENRFMQCRNSRERG